MTDETVSDLANHAIAQATDAINRTLELMEDEEQRRLFSILVACGLMVSTVDLFSEADGSPIRGLPLAQRTVILSGIIARILDGQGYALMNQLDRSYLSDIAKRTAETLFRRVPSVS